MPPTERTGNASPRDARQPGPEETPDSVDVTGYRGLDAPVSRGNARVLRRILGLVMKYPGRVSLAIAGTLAAAAFQLTIPHLLGSAVDEALGLLDVQGAGGAIDRAVARQALIDTALLLLGASMLRGLFTLVHNYFGETVGHRIAYDLRLAFYGQLQRLSFSFHDAVHSGELITRGMLDLEGVRMFFSTGVLRLILLAVLIGIGAWMLLSTDPLLGAVALSFVPFVAWRSSVARLKLRSLWLALQERMGVIGRVMDENLTGIRVVRAFGAEDYEMDKYQDAADDAMVLARQRIKTRVDSTTSMTFAFFVSMGLVLWLGGMRVIDGTMTVGTLTEFLTFMTILQMPVRQLGLMVNSFARASTCGSRLFAVLDLVPDVRDADDARPLALTDGVVRFEDVCFAYGGPGAPPAIDGVSFEVRRGRSLGIVGPPGSGKSTIAQLMARFYDVDGGRITIDGQDIRDVTLASLREAVRAVPQDPFLFTSSLDHNIAYGDPWAEDGEIRDSAALARIDGFIEGLNQGYGTLVGERGVSLSGGQKQRVAIARTAMLEPAVLILDDSMAAIDAGTERQIRRELRERMANSATILISHRLSGLRDADEIVFLEHGRIVERGTHDSLLAANGRYAALYALQTRSADVDVAPANSDAGADIKGAAE